MLTNAKVLDEGIRRVIKQADKSGDETITFEELVEYLKGRGCAMETDHAFVKEWIKEVDFYHDGVLDFYELKMWGIARLGVRGDIRSFLQANGSTPAPGTLDEGLKAFMAAVDETGSESLNVKNLLNYSLCNGTAASESEVERFVKDADTNGDGSVTYDELKEYCLKNMGVGMFIKRMLNNGKDLAQGVERIFAMANATEAGVNKDELIALLRSKGVALTTEGVYAKAWFDEVDVGEEQNGLIDKAEVTTWAEKWVGVPGEIRALIGEGTVADAAKAYLAAADLVGNGVLAKSEIVTYSSWRGSAVSIEQVDALFADANTSGSGELTVDELVAWAEKTVVV